MRTKVAIVLLGVMVSLILGSGTSEAVIYRGSYWGHQDQVLTGAPAQKLNRIATDWRKGRISAKQAVWQCRQIGDPTGDIICWDMLSQALAEQHVTPAEAKRWMRETRGYWYHPDSGDGFGPGVPLPPACLRLEGLRC